MRNSYRFIFLLGLVISSLQGATAQTLKIATPAIEIEVRDAELFVKLKEFFKEPARIPFGKEENAILKGYEGQNDSDTQMILVSDLKDLIDEKAMLAEGSKFSDMKKEIQEELLMLAELREQIAFNWTEKSILSKDLKNLSLKDIETLIVEELALSVTDKALKVYFCSEKSAFKASDCNAKPAKATKKLGAPKSR